MKALTRLLERLYRRPTHRDVRSRVVVFVPHCALNQNARAPGAAETPAAIDELIEGLLARRVGIVQLPCPELCAFGLDRAKVKVEIALREGDGSALCKRLASEVAAQIETYRTAGIQVLGVLGKNGSPSCGVEETWTGSACEGRGAFVDALLAEIEKRQLPIAMAGIRDSDPAQALATVDNWLAATERGGSSRMNSGVLVVAALSSLLAATTLAQAQAADPLATLVQCHTVCSDCHASECGERLSLGSDPDAALARRTLSRRDARDERCRTLCHAAPREGDLPPL
jgi:predicted secreted protein